MSTRRERVGLVLLGIFLGLVIAASLFWWQEKVIRKEWFSYKGAASLYHYLFDRKDDVLTLEERQKKTDGKLHKPGKRDLATGDSIHVVPDSMLVYDSAGNAYLVENGAFEYYIESDDPDSLRFIKRETGKITAPADTASSDSASFQSSGKATAGELVFRRDRFILSRTYKVSGYPDSLMRPVGRLDSLLTNDGRTKRLPGNMIRIEFWSSPVNYTGYKLSDNKMVLFGNFNPDEIALEFRNRRLLMRYKNKVFPLELTQEFQPLVSTGKP